jgi:hypothetical protein
VLGNMGLTEAENEHIFRDFASWIQAWIVLGE